ERGEGTICLCGPPGTGNTAFARQLVHRLERPFLHKSAGDLLDMYVGATEKARRHVRGGGAKRVRPPPRRGRRPAATPRRRRAQLRAHSVKRVLVRIETFRGIFLCATNAFHALDPAASA